MNDLIDSLDLAPPLAPENQQLAQMNENTEQQQTKLGRNAKRKLRLREEKLSGPLPPKPRLTRAPDKKKRKGTHSTVATSECFGQMLRKWMITLPPQNGFLMDIPATALDLFDDQKRVPTKADLDNFDDDPDDLGASTATPHHPSQPIEVAGEGIFLPQVPPQGASACACEHCESLWNLPPTKPLPPSLAEPDYALIRYKLNLPLRDQQRLNEAIDIMERVLASGERCCRSHTDSWHVGPWSKYRHIPRMTVTVSHQSKEAKVALDEFAGLVTELAVKPIAALLKNLDPQYHLLATRINTYVQLACKDNNPLTPNLMWAPLFNVAAFRWGVGEFSHLDNDPKGLYAFLLAAKKFDGGRFCLPHVKLAIPFGPFTVILVLAAKLVHFAEQFEGSRFIFTGFIDYNTAIQAGIGCEEFLTLSDEEFVVWIKERIEVQWAKERAMEEGRLAKMTS
ncbi:hypothetical protein FRC04_003290 [Tulasnella sp. 424]|nr:hypothetical protein FRC04_003290 [Tulasnella sp. 424]KAG8977484.1 hypothetical protein FRC05_001342 [Tulasnella sp. 425]